MIATNKLELLLGNKWKIKIAFFLTVYLLCLCSLLFSQDEEESTDENAQEETTPPQGRTEKEIDAMVQQHKLRLGILRIQPILRLRTGYDNNALFRGNHIEGDYFAAATPGASVGVKIGHRAFVRAIEQVEFLYYHKFHERRDIYPITRGEVITGSDNVLVRLLGGYVRRKDVIDLDEEIDVPVDRRIIDGRMTVTHPLTQRMSLSHSVGVVRHEYIQDSEFGSLFLNLRNHQTYNFTNGFEYAYKQDLSFIGDFTIGHSRDLDSDQSSNFWSVLGGIRFVKSSFTGSIRAGFGEGDTGEERRRHRFLIDGTVERQLGRRLQLGAFASRKYETSAFLSSGFRVTTIAGIHAHVPLVNRLSINGSLAGGVNDYGNNLIEGQPVKNDHFLRTSAFLSVRVYRRLALHFGGTYTHRDTQVSIFNRKRFTYLIGFGYSFTLD
jgi:Uncharacterized protein conserved in bacteria (DUF2320).